MADFAHRPRAVPHLPTFSDVVNFPGEIKTDGVSILPDLKGAQGVPHKYLYWDYGHARNTFKQALRYGKYKAIRIERDGLAHFELYDLEKDPGERTPVNNGKIKWKMRGLVIQFQREMYK